MFPKSFSALLSVLFAVAVLYGTLLFHGTAQAAYTPPALPYYWTTVGASGAKLQNQGTQLSLTDSVNAWNSWTSKTKLSSGTDSCGTTTACIIFANEGATLYYTYCTLPYVGGGW